MSITEKQALKLVERCLASAESQSLAIAAVIVDAAGAPLAGARMPGAHAINYEAARKKAFTACVFKMSTQDFSTQISRDQQVQRALDKEPDMNLLPGGIPIKDGETVIGALGVAGGFYMQDQAIAEYALSDDG